MTTKHTITAEDAAAIVVAQQDAAATDQHAIRAEIGRHLAAATNAVQRAMGPAEAYDTDPDIYDRVTTIWEALRALEDALAAQS